MAGEHVRKVYKTYKNRERVGLLNPDESQNKKSLTLVVEQTIWLSNRRLKASYVMQ